MIPLSETVRKFEHDRKCQPWWSFHQERGNTWWKWRHCQRTQTAELESPDWAPVAAGMVQCYPQITITSLITIIWPLHDLGHHHLSPPEQMTCPTLLLTACPGMRWHIWDYSSPGWGWPVLVVMFTVQAMTFLPAVRAKAKHPSAIGLSRMEHKSGIETSASNDNHTDSQQCQGKSNTMTTVYHVEERGGCSLNSPQLAFTWMSTLHLHYNKSA